VPPPPHSRRTRPNAPVPPGATEAYYASRTLQALELLTFNDLSCPQVAATLQIHPRTARRLLLRLAADGYIEQSFDSRRRYRATLRVAALGSQLIAHHKLPRVAARYVAELSAATDAAAHLFIPSYRGVVCVVHCDTSASRPEPALRELLPAHATAAGKVLLAFRQSWRDSILTRPLPRYAETTITSALQLDRAATETRARGYAIDHGEYEDGAFGIAAPVFVGQDVPAALAISGPRSDAFTHHVDALAEHVMSTAAALRLTLNQPAPASDDSHA
jgi:IclR family transcriptional regulator, acetate operon repressor